MKRYNRFAIIVLLLFFTLSAKAVFEGRSESLEQYQSVRNQTEIVPMNQNTANSIDPTDGDTPVGKRLMNNGAFSDSPLLIFVLGGLGCCSYVFIRNRKTREVKN